MRTSTVELADLLGGKEVFNRQILEREEMRDALRKGIPYSALESLAETIGIEVSRLTQIVGVAPRTLARRKKSQSPFSATESDRIYRLARIFAIAVDVLGSKEKAREWLFRPNRALGGESPIKLLDTDIGARQVEEVLGRIEHGVFS